MPAQTKVPRKWFFIAYSLNLAVAVYCFTQRNLHDAFALGSLIVAPPVLWNLHYALNREEIFNGTGRRPYFGKHESPGGYWLTVGLFTVIYLLTLLIPLFVPVTVPAEL